MIDFVFYTNLLVPKKHDAYTYGPFIFIRPSKKGDPGLLAHERVHVRQFWQGKWFCSLKNEVEAYREQLKYYDKDYSEYFAERLAFNYGFSLTKEEALSLLKSTE